VFLPLATTRWRRFVRRIRSCLIEFARSREQPSAHTIPARASDRCTEAKPASTAAGTNRANASTLPLLRHRTAFRSRNRPGGSFVRLQLEGSNCARFLRVAANSCGCPRSASINPTAATSKSSAQRSVGEFINRIDHIESQGTVDERRRPPGLESHGQVSVIFGSSRAVPRARPDCRFTMRPHPSASHHPTADGARNVDGACRSVAYACARTGQALGCVRSELSPPAPSGWPG